LFLVAGCGEKIEPGRISAEAPAIRGLGLQSVQMQALERGESFVGTVESADRSSLAARIAGRVAEMPTREGEAV
jgi:multidrug efflux pump subunit AcrA (membrane-fusion protein)